MSSIYQSDKPTWALEVGDVISSEKVGEGRWVVVSTRYSGGGTAHGPHDVYPDGWTVYLENLHFRDLDNRRFYQSGAFQQQAMLMEGEFEVVGTARKVWEVNPL